MNARQIKRFRNLITSTSEANKKEFGMTFYTTPCGTPMCVLGNYAARRDLQRTFGINGHNGRLSYEHSDCSFKDAWVQDHFGITLKETYELFGVDGCGDAETPTEAVKYLKQFLKSKLNRG